MIWQPAEGDGPTAYGPSPSGFRQIREALPQHQPNDQIVDDRHHLRRAFL